MLQGAMQDDFQLTVQHILGRMRGMYGDSEVVTQRDGGRDRASYAEVGERVDRLASALASLGVGPGDRVGTFCWNSQQHLELYLAIPSMGSVLHTLNIRLFEEQLTYVINHAQDKVIVLDCSLVPLLEKVLPELEGVEHYVVIGDGDTGSLPDPIRYEELLAEQEPGYDYPQLEERQAAGLCYTSGTTGNPKGVLYSHRSTVLHSMAACLREMLGVSSSDRVMPVVPMFHANAWGLAYASVLIGADLVMPARFLQAEPLVKLVEEEKVTVAAAVPTIWMDVLRHADEHQPDLSSLRLVPCGGSAVPLALMRDFEERHGVHIVQAWGMTETSPLGSVARPPANAEGDEHWSYRDSAGRLAPLVEARLIAEDGSELPWDGESAGELEVRGPWIAASYYEDPRGDDKFHDGWLRTGDVASIDERGFIRISDRAKDVIKSGGEWISSVDLEVQLMAHPAVREAAVIAKPDERWSERPLACVVPEEGESPEPAELREHLSGKLAKWQLPDAFAFIDEVPKTSVGKFDKKVLRRRLEDGELEVREEGSPGRKEEARA
ncbi:MAG: long-chain fatty acid--CoA ligase [Thermoleophilaceae bacterium]